MDNINKHADIGNRIKALRGTTPQKEFAEKLGISLQGYLRYEYGKRIPPGPVLEKMAELCHTTTDYILTGKKPVTVMDVATRLLVPEETRKAWGELATVVKLAVREIEAERAAEQCGIYHDDLTRKILDMLKDMNDDQKRDALRFIEGQKLLAEREKKSKEG